MKLQIDRDDAEGLHVDRHSSANPSGAHGFDVSLNGFQITFEDEADAIRIAETILLFDARRKAAELAQRFYQSTPPEPDHVRP